MTWILRKSDYDNEVHAYAKRYTSGEHAYWEAACHHTTPAHLIAATEEVTPTCFACMLPFGETTADALIASLDTAVKRLRNS